MTRNTRTLTFDLLAKNSTGKGFKDAGRDAQSLGRTMSAAGAAAAAGFAVAGAAAVAFGISSVKAFAEAQAAQERLNFAFDKFPALADVTRQSFDKLNKTLQGTTGFDDDLIASSQGVLAQFGLTGTQIQRLTPLLLDYARAQGKDLTTSAEDLGRALLGQGRALKTLGLDFDDAGSVAANYDQLIAGLTTNVAGYAETFGTTAAGKFEILTVKWGDFQEQVGEALLPGLEKLMEFAESDILPHLTDFAEWFGSEGVGHLKGFIDEIDRMNENGTLVPAVVAGIGAITGAQLALNLAMLANPAGLVIAGLAALAAVAAVVIVNWNTVTQIVAQSVGSVGQSIGNIAVGVAIVVNNMVNGLLAGLQPVLNVINSILRLLNLPTVALPGSVNFVKNLQGLVSTINSGIGAAQRGGVDALQLPRNLSGFGQKTPAGVPVFAEGGIVRARPGGTLGLIGEAGDDEAILPLNRKTASMLGGRGDTYNVTIQGFVGIDKSAAVRAIVRGISDARKLGDIPGTTRFA